MIHPYDVDFKKNSYSLKLYLLPLTFINLSKIFLLFSSAEA